MRYSLALNIGLVVAGVAFGIYQGSQSKPVPEAHESVTITGQPPPAELKKFMEHAIAVYTSQDFSEIVKLMPPMEVQILQPRGKNLSLDELAKLLRERPEAIASAQLNLQELQAIQNKTPSLEDDGTRAVYKLDTPIQTQTQVVFVKVGHQWYMP